MCIKKMNEEALLDFCKTRSRKKCTYEVSPLSNEKNESSLKGKYQDKSILILLS